MQTIKIREDEYICLRNTTSTYPFVVDEELKQICMIRKKKDAFFKTYFLSYCEVLAREININSRESKIRLKYFDGISVVEDEFSSEILSKFGLRELLKKGIRFNEDDSKFVVQYLLISERHAPVLRSFDRHKFFLDGNNHLCCFYNRLISDVGDESKYVYRGKLDIFPSGNLDDWLQMVRTEVVGKTSLEFVLMSSFASPLLAILNLSYDLGSVLIHLANKSSRGKTTAAMLAASVFSNPLLNKGTAISFNATENALSDFISGCNGLPVVLDESAVSNVPNIQKLLYTITLGRSKMRLSGDSSQKEVKCFSSFVFSTAEVSFIDEESLDGIKTRVFQITSNLTTSASNSDNIKRCVIKNYALAGEKFIGYLISLGESIIISDYEKAKSELFRLYTNCKTKNADCQLVPRILSKLSIVFLAHKYFEKVFDFNLDLAAFLDYIIDLIDEVEPMPTIESRILDIVNADVVSSIQKYHKFPDLTGYVDTATVVLGLIRKSKDNGYYEVCVLAEHFQKLMNFNGISGKEYRSALRSMRKKGLLVSQADRQVSKITISEDRPPFSCYIFKFERSEYDETTKEYFEKTIQ